MTRLTKTSTTRLAIVGLATMTLATAAGQALAGPFAIGGLQQNPGSGIGPQLSQLGSSQAYVPMKHQQVAVVNGNQMYNHVLANKNGNLNMRVRISMTCPTGQKVTHLSYQPQGLNSTTVINAPTPSNSYSTEINIQPFSLQDLEKAGQEAFGGPWISPNTHHNHSKTVQKTLKKSIAVRGQCEGWANKQTKNFPVLLNTTFEDKSFFVPVP